MSLDWASKVVTNVDRAAALAKRLVVPAGETLWAILEGASIPKLPEQLEEHRPNHACLLLGDLTPDLAAAAPYLVEIKAPGGIATRVLGEGWGKHWGIYLTSRAPMSALLAHFRPLQIVRLPSGKTAFFRFYDPRILKLFLPSCDQTQANALFGPVTKFLFEGENGNKLIHCARTAVPLVVQSSPL
jgi:hypothetical protein